jgi:hypothetical protein
MDCSCLSFFLSFFLFFLGTLVDRGSSGVCRDVGMSFTFSIAYDVGLLNILLETKLSMLLPRCRIPNSWVVKFSFARFVGCLDNID